MLVHHSVTKGRQTYVMRRRSHRFCDHIIGMPLRLIEGWKVVLHEALQPGLIIARLLLYDLRLLMDRCIIGGQAAKDCPWSARWRWMSCKAGLMTAWLSAGISGLSCTDLPFMIISGRII